MDINYDIIIKIPNTFQNTKFQNTFILGRPRGAILAGIIKIATIFIKEIIKDSK